ncbi:MAG: tetraacyldisaccharide 4'-kinase [Pseudomonadota bacterium]|nr:tetraacyldisaccharide 4'-kinase [Pseudomonadota bacterium]
MRSWWQGQPGALAAALRPFSGLYAAAARRERERLLSEQAERAPVPVVVVGNLVVGGAGKTPTVIALVQAFEAAGHHPGVVSRGFGRATQVVAPVRAADDPRQVGDEPLLIARRTGVPVWVGRDRLAAARALCATHPGVDLLISDDGLQHHALAREAELIVFDDRGAGNGLLLPAGPLREPLPATLSAHQRVLYTGTRVSTALPGSMVRRQAGHAQLLTDWWAGASAAVPLAALRGRRLLAVAGMADPAKFFDMLEIAGLSIDRWPLPDHHPYTELPWPSDAEDVITTEKDAVKLAADRLPGLLAPTLRVWVVPLDLKLPAALVTELAELLFPPPAVTPCATAPATAPLPT